MFSVDTMRTVSLNARSLKGGFWLAVARFKGGINIETTALIVWISQFFYYNKRYLYRYGYGYSTRCERTTWLEPNRYSVYLNVFVSVVFILIK